MDNTNPADWTDAEMARWMAERDGYEFIEGRIQPDGPPYPHSLDAAVGWLGRMGLIWQRKVERHDKVWIDVFWGAGGVHCDESPTCSTARALCNAGWAAVMAREANDDH